MSGADEREWWRGATIYQVYLRSFCDSNGDGQGDLPGLTAKLDYIESLGVDAIWLSPLHPSPNRDWGYDVSDYDAVHPDYGTLADFERLIAQAHARGIKVLLDEVLSHTSDEHPWFQASAARQAGKEDWYIWADPKLDGTAPNNWLSEFGGPAWSYHPARRQYFHHKFLRQQPRLDWHRPGVRNAAAEVLKTWLERGADGFRLDVANSYLHDKTLVDNPPVPESERNDYIWAHVPRLQRHVQDSNRPENIEALDFIRRTVEQFPDRFVFGEFFEDTDAGGSFASPDKGLHSTYTFDFIRMARLEPGPIKAFYEVAARHEGYWPTLCFSNHDVTRIVTRFGGGAAMAKLVLALSCALQGTLLVYQGEELGLPEAELRREQLRDPVGDLYYPVAKGRDGCRTPMPWDGSEPSFGFTSGKPWLPVSGDHGPLSVAAQEKDRESVLHFARLALGARRKSEALRLGDIQFLDAPDAILAFYRRHQGETALCIFNTGEATQELRGMAQGEVLLSCGEIRRDGASLMLGALSGLVMRI
jgi:alpha-glucosidase